MLMLMSCGSGEGACSGGRLGWKVRILGTSMIQLCVQSFRASVFLSAKCGHRYSFPELLGELILKNFI